jgi:iron complex transport system permease protein
MLLLLLGCAGALSLLRVMIDRPPGGALSLRWPDEAFAAFRWKSVAMAVVVGASLAVSGVLLQALLRNALASPFVLGVSSGAGLGVTFAMYIGWRISIGSDQAAAHSPLSAFASTTLSAMVGGIAVLAIVYSLGRRRGLLDPLSLVLVGVVISAMCGAGMMVLELLVPNRLRGDLLMWMMGRIDQGIGSAALAASTVIAISGIALSAMMGRAMDAATLGDDEARSVGLNLRWTRLIIFLVAGALAAMTVAIAGPIAFVGLIAPHAGRLLVGPRHTMLVIASALAGAAILIAADTASAAIELQAGRIPVGVFTALIGGPTFIWLLKTGRGQS